MYGKFQNVGNYLFAGFLKKVLMMLFVFNVCLGRMGAVYGNNVRISGEPDVQLNATSDSLSLTFTLSWDNSWRDNFNWDAVWLFVKYKKEGSTDAWSHLYLGSNQTGTSMLSMEPGNTGSQIVGAFVYPKNKGTFNIAGERVTLKAPLNGLSASDITDKKVYFAVSAIEMVLIPYGAYYLGDGVSHLAFHEAYVAERNPIRLNGYKSLSASSIHPNQSASLPVNAIDNNIGTHYHSAGAEDEWFMIDFGMRKEMHYFTIRTHYGGTGYFLEGSNDMNTWSILWSGSGSDWSQTLSRYKITTPGSYQYYRFREKGNYLVIYDVALWEDDVPVLWVDSESVLYYSISKNSLTEKLQIPSAYPKGYKGFYIMKYELSQEQYCNFLNMLSYTQQKNRIGNNLDNLKRGDYVFGDTKRPSCRNGIAVFSRKSTSQPAIFGCNLNPAEPFFAADDGQTVACNYMTGADMLSYLDWSGLRPMSELEYEKACRTPNRVTPGEYAWNTTSIQSLGGQGGLSGATLGTENEIPVNANINANSGVPSFGPVRCGSFGTSSTNQEQSGGTFYGVMEMSGNLGEICYSVTGGSSLNTSSSNNEYHGDGVLAADGNYNVATYWNRSNDATAFSVRGGSFASPDSLLRISNRSVTMVYNNTLRDSCVTFRGVRSLSGYVDPGEIDSDATCPGLTTINSVKDAQADCDLSYLWYVKRPGSSEFEIITGEKNSTLEDFNYENIGTASNLTYTFRRKAIALIGEAYVEKVLTLPNSGFSLSSEILSISKCVEVGAGKVTATPFVAGGNFSWLYRGQELREGVITEGNNSVFSISRGSFGEGENDGFYGEVQVKYTINECSNISQISVNIERNDLICPLSVVDDQGNQYSVVRVGCQCWMKQNLRRTDVEHCPVGNPVDMGKYGVHYYWLVVMNGEGASSANPSGVRGLCPDGWHLPSVSEWQEVIDAYGGAGIAGGYMKTKMNMSLAGFGYGCSNSGVEGSGIYGSTENDGYNNGIRILIDGGNQTGVSGYMGMASYPYSYRCLKD
ncbi:MAG: hypothetical protein NC410_10590 [Oscillibacter sp.]|nr:hypothetical protein [Oscillibacter sp.]